MPGSISSTPMSDAGNVKVYRALLTQTSTSAPVATVMENSLGGALVWTRSALGIYVGTLSGVFTVNKTFPVLGAQNTNVVEPIEERLRLVRTDANTVTITSGDGTDFLDALLNAIPIEIRIYP